MSEDYVVLSLAVITLIITISTTSRYLIKTRELNSRIEYSSSIVEGIVTELRSRLNNEDSKIMDQEVKTEILELKVARLLQEPLKESLSRPHKIVTTDVVQQAPKRDITINELRETKPSELTETEQEILRQLAIRDCTTTEIQGIVMKTREHTARLLKKLFDEGYIERDENKRPYAYRLVKTRQSSAE